jgi:hypothetical protein
MSRRVFVSYSHGDPALRPLVPSMVEALRADGFEPVVDTASSEAGAGDPDWQRWCREQITGADMIVCICTGDYRERFERRVGGGAGRGVEYEGRVLETSVYDRDVALISKCVVLRPEGSRRGHVPHLLRHVPEFRWPQQRAALAARLRRGPLHAIRVAPPRSVLFTVSLALAIATLLAATVLGTAGTNAEEREVAADFLAWELVGSIPYPGDDEARLEEQGERCQEFADIHDSFLRCRPWTMRPRWPGMAEQVLRGLARIDPGLGEESRRFLIFRADFGPTPLPVNDYRLLYVENELVVASRAAAVEGVRSGPGGPTLRGYHELLRGAAASAVHPWRWARLKEALRSDAPRPQEVMKSEGLERFLERAAVARIRVGDLELPAVGAVSAAALVLLLASVVVLTLAAFGLARSRRIVPQWRRQHLAPGLLTLCVVGTVPLALGLLHEAVAGLRWPLPGSEVAALAAARRLVRAAMLAGAMAAVVAALSQGRDRVRSAGHP